MNGGKDDATHYHKEQGNLFRGTQKGNFKRERDRVKEHVGDGTWFWWLRSPFAGYSYFFVIVIADGTVYYYNAFFSLGFAPGFDL